MDESWVQTPSFFKELTAKGRTETTHVYLTVSFLFCFEMGGTTSLSTFIPAGFHGAKGFSTSIRYALNRPALWTRKLIGSRWDRVATTPRPGCRRRRH